MDYLATHILGLIKAHPDWTALVIGLVAFGESFVFLSLLFPGTTILIASGVLIDAGSSTLFRQWWLELRARFWVTLFHSGWVRNSDLCFRIFGRSSVTPNALRA